MSESDLYLPRFEFIEDNFGHSWTHGINTHNYVLTDKILRPGDLLVFTAAAYNPTADQLFYKFNIGPMIDESWQLESCRTLKITEAHISRSIAVYMRVKRKVKHVFFELEDNIIQFRYTVML